ncbi:DNA-binding protein [Streptomyces sp. NPDC002619]|uniref:DNA-binding protein n=1 Tax=Streptomyces sp. NPDC002619 TaxID=3364655 RepID=UPI00369737E7
MIPQGREVRSEAEVAEAMGVPLHSWRRKVRDGFEEQVTRVNADEGRIRLYDAEQVTAYVGGRPIPPLPTVGVEHPDDLLTDREAGALLWVDASTVRSYAVTGYLPRGVELHGRRWPRRVVLARLEQGDQREHPERTGAGRPKSSPQRPNRGRAGRDESAPPDPRIVETAEVFARAVGEGAKPPTSAQIAAQFGVSRSTGARILAAARARLANTG